MADDYALTDTFICLKNKGVRCVSNLNYVENRFPSYHYFDTPKSGSWQKNRKSYRPIEIVEIPKSVPSCSYWKKKGHLVS